jgi:hypothetical protein
MRIYVDKGKLQRDLVWLFINILIIVIIIFTLSYDYREYFGDFAKIKLFVLGIVTGFLLSGFVRGTFRISAGKGKDD